MFCCGPGHLGQRVADVLAEHFNDGTDMSATDSISKIDSDAHVGCPSVVCSPCSWTSEKPAQTGWYWWDPQGPREIGQTSYSGAVEIVKVDVQRWDGKLYMSDDSAYGENPLIDEIPGRWAGPIPFPAENKEF